MGRSYIRSIEPGCLFEAFDPWKSRGYEHLISDHFADAKKRTCISQDQPPSRRNRIGLASRFGISALIVVYDLGSIGCIAELVEMLIKRSHGSSADAGDSANFATLKYEQ